MKAGTTSQYPLAPLPKVVVTTIDVLILLLDAYEDQEIQYQFSPGSQDGIVDLRKSVQTGQIEYVVEA